MEDIDRCDDLEETIDKLDELLDSIRSKDIKADLEYIIEKYYGEYKELNDKLAKEIPEKLHKTEEEVKAIFSYFDIINNFERDLANLDTKQG